MGTKTSRELVVSLASVTSLGSCAPRSWLNGHHCKSEKYSQTRVVCYHNSCPGAGWCASITAVQVLWSLYVGYRILDISGSPDHGVGLSVHCQQQWWHRPPCLSWLVGEVDFSELWHASFQNTAKCRLEVHITCQTVSGTTV